MSAVLGATFMAACGGATASSPSTIPPANMATATRTPTVTPTATPTLVPTPTNTPVVPAPVPQSVAYAAAAPHSVEQWRELVSTIFPASAVDAVLTIMLCESGGNPNATGAAGERGLMQIHPLHRDSTYDPVGNLLAAYRISGGGVSWSAWTCKPGRG